MYAKRIKAELDSAKKIQALAAERELSEEEIGQMEAHLAKANELKSGQKKLEALNAELDGMGDFIKESPAPRSAQSIEVIEGPKANAGFKSNREFFYAVSQTALGKMDDRLKPLAAVGSDENKTSSDPYGGFLVPEGFVPSLKGVTPDSDPTASLVTEVPMETSTIKLPARVDKDHSDNVTGGFTVYRKKEATNATSSRGEYEQIIMNANSLTGITYQTEELLQDSPMSIAALLDQSFEQAFADRIFREKIDGTGVGEMEGVLSSPAKIEVAKESGQAADSVVYANIVKMVSRLWGMNGIWLANKTVMPQLAQLGDAAGTKLIWMPSIAPGTPATLMGMPIFFTEYAKTVGDAGDLILCDWSQYLYGIREDMNSESSIHVRFESNETGFRFTMRNDGRCWWRSALTPVNGETLSPIVTLAARA